MNKLNIFDNHIRRLLSMKSFAHIYRGFITFRSKFQEGVKNERIFQMPIKSKIRNNIVPNHIPVLKM